MNQAGAENGAKPGAEPTEAELRWYKEAERRGERPRDSTLIARSGDVGIWHTTTAAWNDCPWWLPPFGFDVDGLYRGFAYTKLQTVLETGLDVPPQSAFFATGYADKAWEYPHLIRDVVTMLVLDRSQAKRSFAVKPEGADDTWTADKTIYPNEYTYGETHVHTRFEVGVGWGTRCFTDESMYGFWVPGDARAALLGVVVGGPQSAVLELLQEVQLSGPYRLEVVN
jgi:hypothetical protein